MTKEEVYRKLDDKIYDLTGRELSHIPRGIVYIKNGQKFIR